METPPSINYENDYDYRHLHDFGYDSPSTSHYDGLSETSGECFSIYEQTSTDSYFDDYEDDLSSNYSIFETDSSIDELQSGSGNTSVRHNCHNSATNLRQRQFNRNTSKPVILSGILKRRELSVPNLISREAIEKIRENELEDVLQHARDIVSPDPTARTTRCSQPAKVVSGSFRHLLSIKETNSKTGAFLHRTIEIIRNMEEDLGFSVREGDGWEKKGGIFVSRVALGTVFEQYGILTVGDEVLQVNKVDIRNMKLNDVVRLMYVPHRLCITIKVLTPFSKKRIADTKIDTRRMRAHSDMDIKPVSDNFYKVAQLQIGLKKREQTKPGKTILVRNKKDQANSHVDEEDNSKKLSPYRTMEGGKPPPAKGLKSMLSPIQEVGSEQRIRDPRKQHLVTWSDQKSDR